MRLKQVRLIPGFVFCVLVSLTLAGCGGYKNFTPEDFKKVQKGMTEDQVTEILGKPFDSGELLGVKRKWWKVDDKYYSASFKDGKVQAAEGPSKEEEYKMMKGLMDAAKKMGQ
jgi:outer membrane protein assembly factor BamE (lipoprotein component of BamABCDE complex)